MNEKLVKKAVKALTGKSSCEHCTTTAKQIIKSSLTEQWFFLSRAKACPHLTDSERMQARIATER